MKFKYYLAVIILTLATLLYACEEAVEYPAKVEHLENIILQSQQNADNSFSFLDDQLTISVSNQDIKPFMDDEDLVQAGTKSEWTIDKYNVKTREDVYHITGTGIDIKLKRIGKRIIQDSDGERYATQIDLK